ncbi:MAG TPA: M24 family metallopeptidase [Woeseiaceae bacterium]|nr:M24 family metallopeptidase [Woeseiaceae bacterium]
MPAFERQEFVSRIDKARSRMAELGMDLMWVTCPANINYLCGYDAWSFYVHQGLLVSAHAPDPVWIGRKIDLSCVHATTYLRDDQVRGYGDSYLVPPAHAMQFVADVILEHGWERAVIGVEMDTHYFTALAFETLRGSLPQCRFVDADRLVNWLRIRKSGQEIRYMLEAGRVTDGAMRAGIEAIAPGVRQCDVAAAVYGALISGPDGLWGDVPDYQTMPKGALTGAPHLTWTAEPYRSGEACTLELGANRFRYHAPLARTVHVGKPKRKLVELAEIVGEGLDAALAAVKPGVTCEDVEAAWRRSIGRYGLTKESRIGYSVGIGYPPDWGERTASLMPGDETALDENMTCHLMLGIWEHNGGYEISETFRVTSLGFECLSSIPRELIVLHG